MDGQNICLPIDDNGISFYCREGSILKLSESDVLRLAAGVEMNTNHPIGKAIVAAAQAVNSTFVKVSFYSAYCSWIIMVFKLTNWVSRCFALSYLPKPSSNEAFNIFP